jgi:hypothetical protein
MDQFDYNPFSLMHLWCWFKFCKSLLLVAWIQHAIVWCSTHHFIHHNFWSSFNVYCVVQLHNFMNFVDNWLEELVEENVIFFNGTFDWHNLRPPCPCPTWTKYIFRRINLDMSTKIKTKSLTNGPSNYMVIKNFNLLIWNIYFKSWYTSRYEDR